MLVVVGCSGSTPSASHTPTPSTSTASASTSTTTPSSNASPGSTPAPGPATLVHCSASVPAGDNLVIGTVAGDPTVVVRDIQDPANARSLCTFDSSVLSPLFVSASAVAYETADNQIIQAQFAGGPTTLLATYGAGVIGSGSVRDQPGRQVGHVSRRQHVAARRADRKQSAFDLARGPRPWREPGRGRQLLELLA